MNYEHALRSIGEWADARHPRHVRIIELVEGFSFQWNWSTNSTAYLKNFLGPELVVLHRRQHVRQPLALTVSRPPQDHTDRLLLRDILRALGHEMDAVGARELLIEDVNEGLLITFQYRPPGADRGWRKHMSMLTQANCAKMVTEAHARRQVKTGLAARLA